MLEYNIMGIFECIKNRESYFILRIEITIYHPNVNSLFLNNNNNYYFIFPSES
jgi:hypothetical protein